jgi:O-antigen/teichoic acid export membrane protein
MTTSGATAEQDGATGSLRNAAIFSTGGILVQGLSKLVFTIGVGRAFGSETLGETSALVSLSIFAALFWPTPAGNTVSRLLAVALHRGDSDARVLRLLGRSFWLSCLVLGLVAVPVGMALGAELVPSLFGAWLVVGYAGYAYARSAQLGRHKATRVALWDALSSFATLAALLGVIVAGLPAVALLPMALGYSIFTVALWPRARPGGAELSTTGVLAFAGWNVIAGLASNGLLQIMMLAAQVYNPGHEAGLFATAFSLATPASMLGQAASQVIIPAFAHRTRSDAPLRTAAAMKLLFGFSALALVAFGALALLGPWIVPLLYGPDFVDAVPLLQYMLIGVFVFTVALIPSALLLANGHSRAVAISSSVGFVVGLVVILVLGPSIGMYAGIWGFSVGSGIGLAALLVLGLRRSAVEPPLERLDPLA